jgi:hypothetical protein
VPFHVEIRRTLRHARVFNLDAATVRERVLEAWLRGGPVELGEHEWDPADSTITVLEGPELAAADLAYGRGWDQAQRTARDVTREVLRAVAGPTRIAVRAQTDVACAVASDALARLEAEGIAWASVRAHLLRGSGAPAGVAAAVVIVDASEPAAAWLLDAGLAVGAFGTRAIVASLANLPSAATDLDVLVLAGDDAAQALGERLHAALAGP